MTSSAVSDGWKAVGARLGQARRLLHLSKRGAAQRAGFSEITWRQLEAGERLIARNLTTPVNPRNDTLAAAARAVSLDPAELFGLVGRVYVREELRLLAILLLPVVGPAMYFFTVRRRIEQEFGN